MEHNRFAIIISSAAVKRSTRRHFWKRQVTGCLERWPNFKKDFLVILSPKMENAAKENIKSEFNRALSHLTATNDN